MIKLLPNQTAPRTSDFRVETHNTRVIYQSDQDNQFPLELFLEDCCHLKTKRKQVKDN